MKTLGAYVVGIAPFALLIGPILCAIDSRWLLGSPFIGIGLSAFYFQIERIAKGLNKES